MTSYHRDPDRNRDRHYSRSRSRSPSRGRNRERMGRDEAIEHRPFKSYPKPISSNDDPELMKSRIFIGNLPSDAITEEGLTEMFSRYGKVVGVTIRRRFGFIQFETEENAQQAVAAEHGGLLKGNQISVKIAMEGRRIREIRHRSPVPYERDRGSYPPRDSRDSHGPPPRDGRDSHGPPSRDGRDSHGPPPRDARDSHGPPRDRSPLKDPYENRYRGPYREGPDQKDSMAHPPPPTPPRRDDRDPYYNEPYRRVTADPYVDRYREDYYRREPFPEPYGRERDYYRDYSYEGPHSKTVDCHVLITDNQLRGYAELIERRLKNINMAIEISILPENKPQTQVVEDVSRRGTLYVIIVNSQNEAHRSLTLNMFHGTPQEHRNMPLDDAMTLVVRSFERYLQVLREKNSATHPPPLPPPLLPPQPPAPSRAPPHLPFLPPSSSVAYLLNLLADNRQLTIEELDKVINYLRERKEKLVEAHGGSGSEGPGIYGAADKPREEKNNMPNQQDFQMKILSMIAPSSTPGSNVSGDRVQSGVPQPQHQSMMNMPSTQGMDQGSQQESNSNMTALINFDNPNVQKALDNLIQSGPNLLRNITAVAQGPPQNSVHGHDAGHGGIPPMGSHGGGMGPPSGGQGNYNAGLRQSMYGGNPHPNLQHGFQPSMPPRQY